MLEVYYRHGTRSCNLDVKSGTVHCILGHNGSGKSTLAKHINVVADTDEKSA